MRNFGAKNMGHNIGKYRDRKYHTTCMICFTYNAVAPPGPETQHCIAVPVYFTILELEILYLVMQ